MRNWSFGGALVLAVVALNACGPEEPKGLGASQETTSTLRQAERYVCYATCSDGVGYTWQDSGSSCYRLCNGYNILGCSCG
jgi:hypothetical protein